MLDSSIKDIASVFDLGILSSSAPGNRPKSAVGENLVGRTKSFMSAQDYEAEVWSSRKKIRRDTSSVPFLDVPLTCGQQLEFAAPSTSECQANLVQFYKLILLQCSLTDNENYRVEFNPDNDYYILLSKVIFLKMISGSRNSLK